MRFQTNQIILFYIILHDLRLNYKEIAKCFILWSKLQFLLCRKWKDP